MEASAGALAASQDHVALRELLGPVAALLEHVGGRTDHADRNLVGMLMNIRDGLAEAYRAAGRGGEAIPLFEQTLAQRERLLGFGHPDTLQTRDRLARAYREAGRSAEAIPLVQQTLADRERLLGADHASTLASRNNLATIYRSAGRPTEAIPLFEQNLAACERVLGADHPRTTATRHRLELARHEAGLSDQVGRDLEDDGA